jgi:hypothetical protein
MINQIPVVCTRYLFRQDLLGACLADSSFQMEPRNASFNRCQNMSFHTSFHLSVKKVFSWVQDFHNRNASTERLKQQKQSSSELCFCPESSTGGARVPNSGSVCGRPRTDKHFGTLVVIFPGNVGIRKAQRRMHGDARRPGRRSSSEFPLLTPTRVSFEPGTCAVRPVSNKGPLAEVFT